MRHRMDALLLVGTALLGSGCVEVQQLIKMQHDGSGTLTETLRVKPRALRLMERQERRTGKKQTAVEFLSDEAVQARAKAFGEVTVKEKKLSDLPDGSRQIVIEYAFRDVNKLRLYVAPLFKCNDKNATGQIQFGYHRIINAWGRKNPCKADQLVVRFGGVPKQLAFSSPSEVQEYRQVTPIFQDMIKDFKFRIEIQAPDDVEEYEKGMVVGMRVDGNRVLVMNAEGANVIAGSELIRGFIQGEVGAGFAAQQAALANTVTPWDMGSHGFSVRYLKLEEVLPTGGEGQKAGADQK